MTPVAPDKPLVETHFNLREMGVNGIPVRLTMDVDSNQPEIQEVCLGLYEEFARRLDDLAKTDARFRAIGRTVVVSGGNHAA